MKNSNLNYTKYGINIKIYITNIKYLIIYSYTTV